MTTRAGTLGFVVAVALAGCGGDQTDAGPGAAEPTETGDQCARDGGGEPPPSSLEAWTVCEPTLSFNGEGGQPTGDFNRITGTLRLSDGRIVVADQQRVRVFDGTGRFLHRFGGQGEGPGEWRGVAWIQYLRGDSLIVGDTRSTGRVSYFALDGTLGRTMRLGSPPDSFAVRTFGAFADGTIVGEVAAFDRSQRLEAFTLMRPPLALLRYGRTGEALESLGTWADTERLMVELPAFRVLGGPPSLSGLITIGLHVTAVTVGPNEVYVSTGERLGASVLGTTGDTLRVVDAPYDPIPIRAEEIVQASMNLALGEQPKQALATMSFDWWPEDKTPPAVVDMLVDDEGNLWLMEFDMDLENAHQFTVVSPEGTPLARVETPLRFSPMHIGDDFMLGVWRDELDVEHVQVRSLVKLER